MKNEDYEDIINLPHYEPKYHPRMSIEARAAQFAPFAALTGYDDSVKETERVTEEEIQISNEVRQELDIKLNTIIRKIKESPLIEVKYFIADTKKNGGAYKTITNRVKAIDEYEKTIKFIDNKKIHCKDIIEINIKDK